MHRMRNLLSRWWSSYRLGRWRSAQRRHQLAEERDQAHLERQRAGIRDNPGAGGGI
jgi:hypothetical protein